MPKYSAATAHVYAAAAAQVWRVMHPVTLVIPYDQQYEDSIGGREYFNQAATLYQDRVFLVDSVPDIFANEVRVTTTHFSPWWVNLISNVLTATSNWLQNITAEYSAVYNSIVGEYKRDITQFRTDGLLGSTINVLDSRYKYSCGDPNPLQCFQGESVPQLPGTCESRTIPNKEFARFVGDAVEGLAYLELLNRYGDQAFDANGAVVAQPSLIESRRKRMNTLVKYGVYLIATEAANLGYNRTDGSSPWVDHGLRGWGLKNALISCSLYSGFQSFGNWTGISLTALNEIAMAVRQYVQDGYDSEVFLSDDDLDDFQLGPQSSSFPYDRPLSYRLMFFRDAAFASTSALLSNPCPDVKDPYAPCFESWKNIRHLTYEQAYELFKAYSDSITDWWLQNASIKIGDFRFYQYTGLKSKSMHGGRITLGGPANASNSVVLNMAAMMARATFLSYKVTNKEAYLDAVKETQYLLKKANWPCTSQGQAVKCHGYGTDLWSIYNFPDDSIRWYGLQPDSLEDAGHYYGTMALNGIAKGHSLFTNNALTYRLSNSSTVSLFDADANHSFNWLYRKAYDSDAKCRSAGWTLFQCSNAIFGLKELNGERSIEFEEGGFLFSYPMREARDKNDIQPFSGQLQRGDTPTPHILDDIYRNSQPTIQLSESAFPTEVFYYPDYTLQSNYFRMPNYSAEDGAYYYYLLEGADIFEGINQSETYELLREWWFGYDHRCYKRATVPDDKDPFKDEEHFVNGHICYDPVLESSRIFTFGVFLAWATLDLVAQHRPVVPDYSVFVPVITSAPVVASPGDEIALQGKNFGNSPQKLSLKMGAENFSPQITLWHNFEIRFRVPTSMPQGYASIEVAVLGETASAPNLIYIDLIPRIDEVIPFVVKANDLVTVAGANLLQGQGYLYADGIPVTGITSWSDNLLTFAVPQNLVPGLVDFTLRVLDGNEVHFSLWVDAPYLSAISPNPSPVGAFYSLTGGNYDIAGSGYLGVNVQTSSLSILSSSTASSSFVVIPPGSQSAHLVIDGVASNEIPLVVAAPAISYIIPAGGISVPGQPPSLMSIYGGYFGDDAASVSINGATPTIRSWRSNDITVEIPELPFGKYPVSVSRFGYSSNTVVFESRPLIESVSPSRMSGGDLVTLQGYFGAAPGQVVLNGYAITPVWAPLILTFTVPNDVSPFFGSGYVSVAGVLSPFHVMVAPRISSVLSATGQATGPDGILTISGTNFGSRAGKVLFGISSVDVKSWANEAISVQTDLNLAGATTVVVRANAVDSFPSLFTFIPVLNAITPQEVNVGENIQLSGTNFGTAQAPAIEMGSNTFPVVSWQGDRADATVPLWLASGTYDVRLVAGEVKSNALSLAARPVLKSLSPNAMPGQLVTATASGLGGDITDISVLVDGMLVAPQVSQTAEYLPGVDTIIALSFTLPLVDTGKHAVSILVRGVRSNELSYDVSSSARIAKIVMGSDFACDLLINDPKGGVVRCWGNSVFGQLGNNSTGVQSLPQAVALSGPVGDLAAGKSTVCAIVGTDIWCWGRNDRGQLGKSFSGPYSAVPIKLNGVNVNRIAAGDDFFCATNESDVYCWGDNAKGQLGRGTLGGFSSKIQRVSGFATVSKLAAGGSTACAGTSNKIVCWGDNQFGQLGDNFTGLVRSTVDASALGIPAQQVVSLSVGARHACSIAITALNERHTECWGDGSLGQLGDGRFLSSKVPVSLSLPLEANSIAAGPNDTCAILANGDTVCWGANSTGQVGTGDFTSPHGSPREVWGMASRGSRLAVGAATSCAIAEYGSSVRCWGGSSFGLLGFVDAPNQAASITRHLISSAGAGPAVAAVIPGVFQPGLVFSIAGSNFGSLTDVVTVDGLPVVPLSWSDNMVAAAAPAGIGPQPTGVLSTSHGSVAFWPDTPQITSISPNRVSGGESLTIQCTSVWPTQNMWVRLNSISQNAGARVAVDHFTLGIDGTVNTVTVSLPRTLAAAADYSTVLEIDTYETEPYGLVSVAPKITGVAPQIGASLEAQPVLISGTNLSNATVHLLTGTGDSILASTAVVDINGHTSGIMLSIARGVSPVAYQLVLDANGVRSSPVPYTVGADGQVVKVEGGNFFTCFLKAPGTLTCRGDNSKGELGGVPDATGAVNLPWNNVSDFAVGSFAACAVRSGEVWCWGDNTYGQLGNGSFGDGSFPPVKVSISDAVAITAGFNYFCALRSSGHIACWGLNNWGQVGSGDYFVLSPLDVPGISTATKVVAGGGTTCAIESGSVRCWGYNGFGQLGIGDTNTYAVPVAALGLESGVIDVTIGQYHSCALVVRDGIKRTLCWGDNRAAQLGQGALETGVYCRGIPCWLTPKEISYGAMGAESEFISSLSAHATNSHTCSQLLTGKVYCWGSNEYGQLGGGVVTDYLATPVQVSGLTTSVSIGTGYYHSCSISNAGNRLSCWGSNIRYEISVSSTWFFAQPETILDNWVL